MYRGITHSGTSRQYNGDKRPGLQPGPQPPPPFSPGERGLESPDGINESRHETLVGLVSMDWFKGNPTGLRSMILMEKSTVFSLDLPFNQSVDDFNKVISYSIYTNHSSNSDFEFKMLLAIGMESNPIETHFGLDQGR